MHVLLYVCRFSYVQSVSSTPFTRILHDWFNSQVAENARMPAPHNPHEFSIHSSINGSVLCTSSPQYKPESLSHCMHIQLDTY